jgi:hypothetical protein
MSRSATWLYGTRDETHADVFGTTSSTTTIRTTTLDDRIPRPGEIRNRMSISLGSVDRTGLVGDPGSDEFPSLFELEKQALVEKPVTHAVVEGFAVVVLHRLAGCDVVASLRGERLPATSHRLFWYGERSSLSNFFMQPCPQ